MKNPPNTRRRSDGLQILERVTGRDAQLRKDIVEANVNFRVAQLIYDARTAAGLTQQQLADLIGTRQSVIARLEDADYRGHSLSMLARIADGLHRQLEVAFGPPRHPAKGRRRKTERRRGSRLRSVSRQA
jgi:ribosome-binding protein aMBF1 (putative translation factor)